MAMEQRPFSDYEDEIAKVKGEFASAGFINSPLTDIQIACCLELEANPYRVGCDVSSGFHFADALNMELKD